MSSAEPKPYTVVYDPFVGGLQYTFPTGYISIPTGVDGISQLTGQVLAGPGSGSQAATLVLASGTIYVGSATNQAVSNTVVRVDTTHNSVGINTTPDTTTYALKVTGLNGVYISGTGSDLVVGRDILVGNDNTGHLITYNIQTKDTGNPLVINNGILQSVRLPQVTTTQKNALSTQQGGCVVFDTTLAKMCVYNGSAWETVTSA